MTTGTGAAAIGSWFGTGVNRGIALVFILTAIIGLIATILALMSRQYRELSAKYLDNMKNDGKPPTLPTAVREGVAG